MLDYYVGIVVKLNENLPAILASALPFIILLGVLVFFHELGHFLVAKYFGVRVEAFSLGFPPKLFGKKIGETEYMVSLLPLGGYVKLAGQDDFGMQQVDNNDPGMYYSKPAWQRFLIVFAGPFANFIIGWGLYTMIFHSGIQVSHNPFAPGRIGVVSKYSPADKAGLISGDEILSVDDIKITSWQDLLELSLNPQADEYTVTVKRGEQVLKKNIRPVKIGKRYLFGISQYVPAEIGKIVLTSDKKENPVFLPGDKIFSIDGRNIRLWESIEEYLFYKKTGKTVFVVERDRKIVQIETEIDAVDIKGVGISDISFMKNSDTEIFMYSNRVESPGKISGIKKDDIIKKIIVLKKVTAEIEGMEVDEFVEEENMTISSGYQFDRIITSLGGKNVRLELLRNNNTVYTDFTVDTGNIKISALPAAPPEYIEYYSYRTAFIKSLEKTASLIKQTFQVVFKIFTRKMDAKDVLGGPITIWKISVASAEAGYKHFMLLMAFLSINLGFINLLPIPVIDGGHLVIYLYEMIAGKIPSEKTMNIIQQIGLVFIIFLMLFTFYVDIAKLF